MRTNKDDIAALLASSKSFTFGDSEELCKDLLRLVRSGAKSATCGALREYGPGLEDMPVVGRRDIALNWDGTPALLLETIELEQVRFCDVGEEFALAEGENDGLAAWRRGHRQYFERNGGFDDQMMLICERFRLIRDFDSQGEQC